MLQQDRHGLISGGVEANDRRHDGEAEGEAVPKTQMPMQRFAGHRMSYRKTRIVVVLLWHAERTGFRSVPSPFHGLSPPALKKFL